MDAIKKTSLKSGVATFFFTALYASVIAYQPYLVFVTLPLAFALLIFGLYERELTIQKIPVMLGLFLMWIAHFAFAITRSYYGYHDILLYYTPVFLVIFTALSFNNIDNTNKNLAFYAITLALPFIVSDYVYLIGGVISSGAAFKFEMYANQFTGNGVWSFNRLVVGACFLALLLAISRDSGWKDYLFYLSIAILLFLAVFFVSRLAFISLLMALFLRSKNRARAFLIATVFALIVFSYSYSAFDDLLSRLLLLFAGSENRLSYTTGLSTCFNDLYSLMLGAPVCVKSVAISDVDSVYVDLFYRTGILSVIIFVTGLFIACMWSRALFFDRVVIFLFGLAVYAYDSNLSKPEFLSPLLLLAAAELKHRYTQKERF